MRFPGLILLACASWCFANLWYADLSGGNLWKNGDFEKSAGNDLSNWVETAHGSAGGELTVINDNVEAWTGNQCVKLQAVGRIGVMQGSRIFTGKRYVASIYARGTGQLDVSLHLYRLDGYQLKALAPEGYERRFSFTVGETWQRFLVPFTGPPEVHSLNISFTTGSKEPLYLDAAQLTYFHPATVRFLPTVDTLAVGVDATLLVDDPAAPLRAEVAVATREAPETPVLSHTITDFTAAAAVWRGSTADLAEGEYVVRVTIRNAAGEVIGSDDDWFRKQIFPWMRDRPWQTDEAWGPYTPLAVTPTTVSPWGRAYAFGGTGLLESVVSQDLELLAGPATWQARVDDRDVDVEARTAFAATARTSGIAGGSAALRAGNLRLDLDVRAEYDGFVRYRLTYGPAADSVKVNRLRLRLPLKAEHAFLYSAGTDRHGSNILGDVFPDTRGKLYDSFENTRAAYCSPNFCTLLWVGGYATCFCYAADSDVGWILRDNAPAVEVWREGDAVVLYLNLVDREYVLEAPRTLEFAFQAGPTKPRPAGWRGVQHQGNPDDAPTTVVQARYQGASTGGGAKTIYPGATPEVRDRMRELRQAEIPLANEALTGYIHYATIPKGIPETAVFRGEWGIDKDTWESMTVTVPSFRDYLWKQQFFGDDPDRYVSFNISPVPSYVECLSYGYNAVLEYLPLSGFYDDVGMPRQVWVEELGLGGRDVDGRKVYSSGQWIYRERWRQAARINDLHGLPNYLKDSQHVRAHWLPAYAWIGLWAPCEHGYYNTSADQDILEFYGSLTRYLAFNPAAQFGQIPMVGLSTRKWDEIGSDRDTRCMMMVTMLHDHDVGSFGARNDRTVCRLRHARNVFRQWEPDARFVGYWENGEVIAAAPEGVTVSLYARPGGAILIVGNVADSDVRAVVRPNWEALGIGPGVIRAIDTETMAPVDLTDLPVARHDLRVILVGSDLAAYDLALPPSGAALPGPPHVLAEYSDTFAGPALADAWIPELHDGRSSVGFLYGKFFVEGHHYGAAHIRRRLDMAADTLSVQCQVLRRPTGSSDSFGGGLTLYWEDGSLIRAIPGTNAGKFTYTGTGLGSIVGQPLAPKAPPAWYPYRFSWVKIVIGPETVRFFSSADGETWVLDAEKPRKDRFPLGPGAGLWLILGNGAAGDRPYLLNPHPQHFDPNPRNPTATFFADLVVGTE